MHKGIVKVYVKPELPGGTPALSDRNTGEVWINRKIFDTLPEEHKIFILLHEEGHIVLNTKDEFEADAYAFKKYAEKGYGMKESVKALSRVLECNNPEHYWRCGYMHWKQHDKLIV